MVVGRQAFPFGKAYFQGRTVTFGQRTCIKDHMTQAMPEEFKSENAVEVRDSWL